MSFDPYALDNLITNDDDLEEESSDDEDKPQDHIQKPKHVQLLKEGELEKIKEFDP